MCYKKIVEFENEHLTLFQCFDNGMTFEEARDALKLEGLAIIVAMQEWDSFEETESELGSEA
jgi:hypothetical protein